MNAHVSTADDVPEIVVRRPRIDAHLHLWDLQRGDYAWLTPQHGSLYSTFTAEMAKGELDVAGFENAILVQAEDSVRDTEFLLNVAAQNEWVAGVVGWIQLDDPAAAAAQLDRWRLDEDSGALCGIRHLVHDDPRDGFLGLATVRQSLSLVAERGLGFDVPDAWPRHLAAVTALATDLPELTVVIDHLAKPPIGAPDYDAWRDELARTAARGNTVAKFSGLRIPGVEFTSETLRPVWDTALELFGPSRLMYGGDWPMTVPAGGYGATWQVMKELIDELSPDEQTMILTTTAANTYRLFA